MTDRTTRIRLDAQFLGPLFVILFWVLKFERQVGYHFWIANMRSWVSVAIETPLHRQRFFLFDDFHFVDPAVAGNAADAFVDMHAVVEVNEVRQRMHFLPDDWIPGFEAVSYGLQIGAGRMDDAQVAAWFAWLSRSGHISAMAIATSRRCWDRGMTGDFNSVMTVPAVEPKVTRVQFVAERNRLSRLMSYVDNRGMDCGEQAGRQITANGQARQNYKDSKLVDPSGKMKVLHSSTC